MTETILALDVGEKKIGVARANKIAAIAEPLVTLPNDENFETSLQSLIREHDVSEVVVGLPRNMNGEETAQTAYVKKFIDNLKLNVTVHFQDETLTSVHAADILVAKKSAYTKEDIDSLAATIILEDYLQEKT